MPQINLDKLDATLLAEIDEQLRDGLITQAEADKLKGLILGNLGKADKLAKLTTKP